MIKAILIDIDGVLVDSRRANFLFYVDVFQKAGYSKPSFRDVAKYNYLTIDNLIRQLAGIRDETEMARVYAIALKTKYAAKKQKVASGSKKVIAKLSKQYKLGVVSGRVKEGIEEYFKACNIKKYLSVCIGFEDYKHPKPSPKPLLIALKRLKVRPKETVYIGDADSDVKAARATKVKVIAFPKKLKGADAHMTSFKHLPALLRVLEAEE